MEDNQIIEHNSKRIATVMNEHPFECGSFTHLGRWMIKACLEYVVVLVPDYQVSLVCKSFKIACDEIREELLLGIMEFMKIIYIKPFIKAFVDMSVLQGVVHSLLIEWDNDINDDVEVLEFGKKSLERIHTVDVDFVHGTYIGKCSSCFEISKIHETFREDYSAASHTYNPEWCELTSPTTSRPSLVCQTCGSCIDSYDFTMGYMVTADYIWKQSKSIPDRMTVKVVENDEKTHINICKPVNLATYSLFRNAMNLVWKTTEPHWTDWDRSVKKRFDDGMRDKILLIIR
jgi:hypothetical protein